MARARTPPYCCGVICLAHKSVRVTKKISAAPNDVWNTVRDFAAPWHPAITSMWSDYSGGHHTRVFNVQGDPSEYRERLTWYSNSERSMCYSHISGIAGALAYDASLVVEEMQEGCRVVMAADLHADETRACEIAQGTQAIFESGLEVLAGLDHHTPIGCVPVQANPQVTTQIVGGTSLSVAKHPTSSTVVLFVHGIGGRRQNWADQIAAVAPFATVAAMDLRGYGSSKLGSEQSKVETYCDDISDVVESLQTKQLVLCGLSFGAWIVTSYAVKNPERVSALILAGGCTGMSEALPSEREAFRKLREMPLSQGQTPADFAPGVISSIAGPCCSDAVRSELFVSMSAISVATYTDALRCFTTPTEVFDFSRLNMPVLMMTGEFDRLAPAAEIRSVANRILNASSKPDVRFECLSNAGHVCNLEASAAFNEPMLELIRRVAS